MIDWQQIFDNTAKVFEEHNIIGFIAQNWILAFIILAPVIALKNLIKC